MQELYYKPLLPWLENEFVLDLGDGTTVKPFDSGYAARMAQSLGIEGTEDELIDMFGIGCWKYDPEAATKLLIKAGLEKKRRRLVLQRRALRDQPDLSGRHRSAGGPRRAALPTTS